MSKKQKTAQLPPGTYAVTIDSVRKVRGKDAVRIKMTTETGVKLSDTVKPKG